MKFSRPENLIHHIDFGLTRGPTLIQCELLHVDPELACPNYPVDNLDGPLLPSDAPYNLRDYPLLFCVRTTLLRH